MILKDRLERVEQRIRAAAERAGRKRQDIVLIAVTKKFSAEVVREAYDLGLRIFGENYVQEFQAKHPALAGLAGADRGSGTPRRGQFDDLEAPAMQILLDDDRQPTRDERGDPDA